ncbi:hypothetical protein B0T21DRAFT_318606 [Apiosordaria backusii]|uniref:Zn(2)-C6 fungal-type domain-containing protein n=1 Tax=Apiosordaria backusii TaxID=314023 RepID=A0AA40AIX8_9PEZI|nr:hypothetical protein B0T21DRAFT_318606 [Apiosordaria backusii]
MADPSSFDHTTALTMGLSPDQRQRAVLRQAAGILAGLGRGQLADAVSDVLNTPISLREALPCDLITEAGNRAHDSASITTQANLHLEVLALNSSLLPQLDSADFHFQDVFEFGDMSLAGATPWSSTAAYWGGLDILNTGALQPSTTMQGPESDEASSESWTLVSVSDEITHTELHDQSSASDDTPQLPVQALRTTSPSLVHRSRDRSYRDTPSGNYGPSIWHSENAAHLTSSDQFERARIHRKSAKKGRHGRAKRRPFADQVQKQQTAATRENKACIRCHLQRIRCFPSEEDPQGICLTCQLARPTICRLPCIRYKVTDVPLFRDGSTDSFIWTKRWLGKGLKDIAKWGSGDTRLVTLTQEYGGTTIEVLVRRFLPTTGDILDYFWTTISGQKQVLECAPFAIVDLEQLGKELKRHVKESTYQYIVAFTTDRTAVLSKTFSMIIQSAERSKDIVVQKLLHQVLELWVASRLIEKPWRVKGQELLDHVLDDNHTFFDPQSPYFGRIPVTPVMDTQLDKVVIRTILLPLKKSIQRSLQRLIEANKAEHWFTIYLCIFVLLSNYEIATQHDRGFAIRYSRKERFCNYPLLEGFHTGAKTLLAHFHYCNKGGAPFQLDWSKPHAAVQWADLSDDQVAYMKSLVDTLKQEGRDFEELKRSRHYEVDGYLLSQLFEGDWKPEYML